MAPSAILSVVHDQIGRLPLIAIGRLDQSEILRRKETILGRLCRCRRRTPTPAVMAAHTSLAAPRRLRPNQARPALPAPPAPTRPYLPCS